MILVTGAYGFIGSSFVKYLNQLGIEDIVVSDYLTNGKQFKNLDGCKYATFVYPDQLEQFGWIHKQVFHFGAISDTTCWDGELIMQRNAEFTRKLIRQCMTHNTPISYSSSASVYGNGQGPMNLYAYSKWLVDRDVSTYLLDTSNVKIQGFRYFNVYALDDSEWHKGNQASPFYKFKQQALERGYIEIFEGSETFKRDFVPVERVCEVQWEMSKRNVSGIFDLGMGKQMSFAEVARQVAQKYDAEINVIPFPEHLKGHYQTSTLANMDYYV